MMFDLETGLIVRALLLCVFLVAVHYIFVVPRPIPGISLGKLSTIHPMGDMPALIRYFRRYGSVFNFITTRCSHYSNPVVQLLLGGSPFVVVGDLRETYDVALRRTKEWGHATRQDKTFQMIAKNATISMPSHAGFWAQRRIWLGIMSTSFLHEVAAPHLAQSSNDLFRLWRRKSVLGAGRYAFDSVDDINCMLMDAFWAILVGEPMGVIRERLELLESTDTVYLPKSPSKPVTFPTRDSPPIARACKKLIEMVNPFLMSPAPDLHRWLLTLAPSFRRAQKLKRRAMADILAASRQKFAEAKNPADVKPECAIDYIVARTMQLKPSPENMLAMSDEHLEDEMFMFLVAGLNTTSLALTWGLKLLGDNPSCQSRLRKEVFAAFPSSDGTAPPPPSPEAILNTTIPYLEAVIWETLRMCQAVPTILRQAETDTELLGHRIPRGTFAIFTLEGEALVYDEEFDVPEASRSASSRFARNKWPAPWPAESKREFIPERWLRRDDEGNEVFDFNAGPNLPFSIGARSCYGQKLVMVLTRLFFVLAVWSCEFDRAPENLAAYEVIEVLTRKAKHGFVKVRPASEPSTV